MQAEKLCIATKRTFFQGSHSHGKAWKIMLSWKSMENLLVIGSPGKWAKKSLKKVMEIENILEKVMEIENILEKVMEI